MHGGDRANASTCFLEEAKQVGIVNVIRLKTPPRVIDHAWYDARPVRLAGVALTFLCVTVGWVPFMLEAMDYELEENAPAHFDKLEKLPSDYFPANWFATFWFETGRGDLQHLVDAVGEDNVMFETDFPHPTSLHPDPIGQVKEKVETLRPETQRKIMGGNAEKLYRLT